MIQLPIWVIRLHYGENAPCIRYLCDERGYVAAFGDSESALAYLVNAPAGAVVHRLERNEAVLLIADMHEFNVPGICLDPLPGRGCRVILPLEALAAALIEPPQPE
jgi:hypothetical protein